MKSGSGFAWAEVLIVLLFCSIGVALLDARWTKRLDEKRLGEAEDRIARLETDVAKARKLFFEAELSSSESEGDVRVRKLSETHYVVDPTHLNDELNINRTDARVVPNFANGVSTGFKLFRIRPGSWYQQAGLRDGDVVESINGNKMTSPDAALTIYQRLRDAKSIDVQLERDGVQKIITYEIQP